MVGRFTGGRYDATANRCVVADESTRCYAATDNLVDERWVGRRPFDVVERVLEAGLAFDRTSATGVLPHLLECLAVDGRMGYIAIGRDPAHVAEIESQLVATLG